MALVDRNASGVLLTPRLIDEAGDPIDAVTHDAVDFTVEKKGPGDTAWQPVTLSPGTLGQWASASWVSMPAVQDGTYELGVPDEWIVAGERTMIRMKKGSNRYQYDAIEATGSVAEANEESIANKVLAGISAIRAQLLGVVDNGATTDLTLTQRTDWNASDGRAIEFDIVDAAIDFTGATAAFGTSEINSESLTATATIENGTVGSCTIRLEFSDDDLDHPVGTYQFNATIIQSGSDADILPGVRGTITLAEDFTQ